MPDDLLKWRRIAETIADDIRSGRQSVGSKLPSADAPAETVRHDADANTIRQAQRYLRDLGVLRMDNRGTFVDAMPPDALPERRKVSAAERRLTAIESTIDELARRLDEHERTHNREH